MPNTYSALPHNRSSGESKQQWTSSSRNRTCHPVSMARSTSGHLIFPPLDLPNKLGRQSGWNGSEWSSWPSSLYHSFKPSDRGIAANRGARNVYRVTNGIPRGCRACDDDGTTAGRRLAASDKCHQVSHEEADGQSGSQ